MAVFKRLKTSWLVIATIAVFAVIYFMLSPRVSMSRYSALLFQPQKFPAGNYRLGDILGVPCQDAAFRSIDGKVLHGWYFKQPEAKYTILVCHGQGGNITELETLARSLLQTGNSVFLFDYRGYGMSEGVPSLEGLCDDGLGAYRFLTENRLLDPHSIVLYGESLGTGVASYLASRVPSAGLVLQSGFSSLEKICREKEDFLAVYPRQLMPESQFNNLANLKGPHPPLLIIHGLKDQTISPLHADELFRETRQPKQIFLLPQGRHDDIPAQPGYVYAVREFLEGLS